MAAKSPVGPFKFGFYAGLGFICAQIVFAVVALIFMALCMGGVYKVLSGNATPRWESSDAKPIRTLQSPTNVPIEQDQEYGR